MGSNVPAMQFQWRGAAGVMPPMPFSTSHSLFDVGKTLIPISSGSMAVTNMLVVF
jgi:hypothetical protein